MDKKKIPEILAPAGNWETLTTAVNAGADAVYLGVKELNMRATAKNFELSELPKIVGFCHKNSVRVFLTINTIIYEEELELVKRIVSSAKQEGVDAIICWDFSVISECKRISMPFHISTQASVSNSAAANQCLSLGAKRVVLARECSLEQIKEIRQHTDIEIEAFVHGAMCVAVSGRCFTSQFLYGRSANRGDCIQPCRRSYTINDTEEDKELVLESNFVMSAKDLCSIKFLDEIIEAGVDSLKIEGRTKGADYVKVVVESYRRALTAYKEGKLDDELKEELEEKLSTVYNRGFSKGFYRGVPRDSDFADQYGGVNTKKKVFVGKVANFYKNIRVADIIVQDKGFRKGDELVIIGPTTGCIMQKIGSIEIDKGRKIGSAEKGMTVGVKLDEIARKNDMVYIIVENDQ
ncbi:MAG: U32 family peptidase [Nanoarchaeota archaeon]|nr:U32 family peptidase [Nanoarchaeota archaeon]